MEERNSSYLEGDQSSTPGSSENTAELCSSRVAGDGFKAAKALGDGSWVNDGYLHVSENMGEHVIP